MSEHAAALEDAARSHRAFLWQLCYRMTGCAADADELVQEALARALTHRPHTDTPLRPWLTRVALNLARDRLRRRRHEADATWLPSPVETGEEALPPSLEAHLPGGGSTEGRYELLESVSFAFLLALEALTPKQRAVLLLCDVFDYGAREVADVLGLSEGNVRVVHLRARRAMAAYDAARCRPTRELQARTRTALEQLVSRLLAQDVAGVEALLAEDVRAVTDGGGEFLAARVPLLGPKRVALFFLRIAALREPPPRMELRLVSGLPALVVTDDTPWPGAAPRLVLSVLLGPDGRIRAIHAVLATRKLTALRS